MNVPQPRFAADTDKDTPDLGSATPKSFMDYNEGQMYDGIGRKVEELIMKTESFIVFMDEFGGIQWGYSRILVTSDNYNTVVNRVAELETRSRFLRAGGPLRDGMSIANHQHALFSARRLLAEAVARLLASNSLDAAQGILDTAEKWIAQRSLECSRRWMLVPFGGLAVSGLLAFFFIVLNRGALPENGSPLLWVLGALLGGVGALISNVSFNRTIPFDATAGLRLHVLEAVLRWLVGVVAGLTVQLLVQGNVVFGFMGNDDQPPVAALVLSLLAGLSELFFPTLLNQFDKSVAASGQPAAQPTSAAPPAVVAVRHKPVVAGMGGPPVVGFEMHPAEYAPFDLVAGVVEGLPTSTDALAESPGRDGERRDPIH